MLPFELSSSSASKVSNFEGVIFLECTITLLEYTRRSKHRRVSMLTQEFSTYECRTNFDQKVSEGEVKVDSSSHYNSPTRPYTNRVPSHNDLTYTRNVTFFLVIARKVTSHVYSRDVGNSVGKCSRFLESRVRVLSPQLRKGKSPYERALHLPSHLICFSFAKTKLLVVISSRRDPRNLPFSPRRVVDSNVERIQGTSDSYRIDNRVQVNELQRRSSLTIEWAVVGSAVPQRIPSSFNYNKRRNENISYDPLVTLCKYSKDEKKILLKIEAQEACKWLRAAGFPQYAQMYEGEQAAPVRNGPPEANRYVTASRTSNVPRDTTFGVFDLYAYIYGNNTSVVLLLLKKINN
ncbi:rho GTPase-activating protein 7 [Vespula squamosa]|uniref:Rho GTPase-activating protein 7 n=1 Tax=Vespula squamosa TaxID=30214 RepID=A0ABD2B396_VESSQ